MAPSCKLELARFSAKLRIQDGAECGNIVVDDVVVVVIGIIDPINLPLKFDQNLVISSRDIADIEFVWVVV